MEAKKKYGLVSGLAMVVGVVIGCGVYFKGASVLKECGGNLTISLIAWLIGGIIMIAGGFCFAKFATKVTKYNGLLDYIEVSSNKRVAYYIGYIITCFYYPVVGAVVATIGGDYFCQLVGIDTSQYHYLIYVFAIIFVVIFVVMNYLAPKIGNYFQISATFVKLIPLILIFIIGLFGSIIPNINRSYIDAFTDVSVKESVVNFGNAVKMTAFVYDGWICATAINAEMRNSEKNLPRALVFGTLAVLLFYIIYFISLSVILDNESIVNKGASAPLLAFTKIFGDVGSKFFYFFILISTIGNVNAMAICSAKSILGLAYRGQGFIPNRVTKNYRNRNPIIPSLFSFGLMGFFVMLSALSDDYYNFPFLHYFNGIDNVICSLLYATFIICYIYMMRKFKDLNVFSRFIMPIVSIIGSLFFVVCGVGLYQLVFNQDVEALITFGCVFALIVVGTIPAVILDYKNNHFGEIKYQ